MREDMAMTEEEVAGQVVASREEGEVEAMVAEAEALVEVAAEEVLPTPHLPVRHSVCANPFERLAAAPGSMRIHWTSTQFKQPFVVQNCRSFVTCSMATATW